MSSRKRPEGSALNTPASKKPRRTPLKKPTSSRNTINNNTTRIKVDPDAPARPPPPRSTLSSSSIIDTDESIKNEFLQMFTEPAYQAGISNNALKKRFGSEKYVKLVPIINELNKDARLTMSRVGEELFYGLVNEDVASKFSGLDVAARLVYQVIEKSENMGIWTKDIRTQTNIQMQALNKIFKILENRKLIKPVKSVTNKSKKLYMLYDTKPSKEITGGPWYDNELEFDHEFISELRKFILLCVKKMNKGKGTTLHEISDKIKQANISRVPLDLENVQQVVQTLAFDYMIEQSGANQKGEALFVPSRPVTSCCEFRWWDVLAEDFHFRTIRFEDDVVLGPHEHHYHTA